VADATSESLVTLELHGFLGDRLAALGQRRGTRTLIAAASPPGDTVVNLLTRLTASDARLSLLFDPGRRQLPEHVEVVLNDRLLDLQGGVQAELRAGDVLSFLPAHAGGL
jgi:molybdopterin converting factor small subunit